MAPFTRIEIRQGSNEIIVSGNNENSHIRIEHLLMEILALLMEHEDKIVEKKTFIDSIWEGNSLMGNTALTKNIFKLREIFKNNGIDELARIETIPKKGYRLLIKREGLPVAKKPVSRSKKMLIPIGAIMLLFCIFLFSRLGHKKGHALPLMTIIGKDTIIQLSDKRPKLIAPGSTGIKTIILDSAKK